MVVAGNAQYTKFLDFAGISNGSSPHGDLVSDGTYLYGMTRFGGANASCSSYGCGVIFKIKPDGTGYFKLLDFDGITNGGTPYGSLIYDGSFLYGMAGSNIFKIKPDGTGYFKLHDFTGTTEGGAIASLISDGTFLYGMTLGGGTVNRGVIFKIKTDGTAYSKLIDFGTAIGIGSRPYGSLFFDGTYLYGMTRQGGSGSAPCGAYGCGTIFKINTDGTGYSDLHDFTIYPDGNSPDGSLISDGTYLYGMTPQIIFKIKPDGTEYTKLLDFTGENGANANGSLVFDGTFLYGMTPYGGTHNKGAVFKIKPEGTEYTKLLDFTGVNGSEPMGALIFDGTILYGMTYSGGTNNMGVIFSLNIGTTTSVKDLASIEKGTEICVFPNPASNAVTIRISTINPKEEFTLKVSDSLGKTVYSETLKEITSSYTKQIALSQLPKGIYFIELQSTSPDYPQKRAEVKKIVLQ